MQFQQQKFRSLKNIGENDEKFDEFLPIFTKGKNRSIWLIKRFDWLILSVSVYLADGFNFAIVYNNAAEAGVSHVQRHTSL